MLWAQAVFQFLFRIEALAAIAVVTAKLAEVNIAGIMEPLQELLYGPDMPLIGRPHKTIVGDAKLCPEVLETGADAVHKFLGRLAFLFRGPHNFVAVFVRTCQKEGVFSGKPVEACQRIRDDGRIGVSEVRFGIDVINGCGDEIGLH